MVTLTAVKSKLLTFQSVDNNNAGFVVQRIWRVKTFFSVQKIIYLHMENKTKKVKPKRSGQSRLDVWLNETTKKRLKEDAKRQKVTVSHYVRSMIELINNSNIDMA